MPGSINTCYNIIPGTFGQEDITGAKNLVESKFDNANDIVIEYWDKSKTYLDDLTDYFKYPTEPSTDLTYAGIVTESTGSMLSTGAINTSATGVLTTNEGSTGDSDIPEDITDADIDYTIEPYASLSDDDLINVHDFDTTTTAPTLDATIVRPTYEDSPGREHGAVDPGDNPGMGTYDVGAEKIDSYSYPPDPQPSLGSITIPSDADYEWKPSDFEGTLVVADIYSLAGDISSMSYNESDYTSVRSQYLSAVGTVLNAKLADEIENGADGLGDTVLTALWARTQAKQDTVEERKRNEAENYYASKGWKSPPGVLKAVVNEIIAERTRSDAQLLYEQTVEEGRLIQTNTHFAVQQGIAFEVQLMTHFDKIANRSLENAKQIVETSVKIYNAKVAGYMAMVENYKAIGSVYADKVRAAETVIQAWKTKMEGAKLESEIEMNKVQYYKEMLGAIQLKVDIWQGKIKAIGMQIEADKQNIEGYKAAVEAYVAKINAKTAEYGLYQSEIDAEKSKAEVYELLVRAYGEEVTAYRSKAEIDKMHSDRDLAKNQELINKYLADIENYKALTVVRNGEVDAVLKRYEAKSDLYKHRVTLAGDILDAETKQYLGKIEEAKNVVELKIKEADVDLQTYLALLEQNVEISKAAVNVSTQMAASALASVNTSASVSFQAGVHDQWNFSYGQQTNNSYIESHEWDE